MTLDKNDHPNVPAGPVETNPGEFPVVGIGASAGGLAAFEAFFSGMPSDLEPGMAFVLVQHLAPDHKSILAELIRRYTRMQVFQVEDGMAVKPNCAYIIPPNCDMAFLNGTLHLLEPTVPRGRRLPIDFFFRSLAQDQHEKAIGIVLSGTGNDGTLGIRAIKGEGGMAMAQSPDSTEYDSMPRSAIATGLIDYELPPAAMARQLMDYSAAVRNNLSAGADVVPLKTDNVLKKIFILLRAQTGHDFSGYKPSMINRRIERQLAVHQIETMEEYFKYLQQTPAEVEVLFRDLLIGVTNFFRDPEAYQTLAEKVIPALFAEKPAGSVIRIWTPGCSTGEEAYSIAILIQEHLATLNQSYKVQIFATDIDGQAVATARSGLYPANIAADVSPERLARFFILESNGSAYRIRKGIRDMLVFSEQDLLKDPPFSKIDLISCRNLLIYLGSSLQKKLISLFHFALNPGGILFLGASESVSGHEKMFSVLDQQARLYHCSKNNAGLPWAAMELLQPSPVAIEVARETKRPESFRVKQPLRELTEQALLKHVDLAGVLINDHGDILYLYGRAGMYLEMAAGEVGVSNILKMAREGLRRELTTALHKAVVRSEIVSCSALQIKTDGHYRKVDLTIRPVPLSDSESMATLLFLVVLEETPQFEHDQAQAAFWHVVGGTTGTDVDDHLRIVALKQELRSKEEFLQSANEELATSNEELKAAIEEMQSVNEELQSTNEELETSKEELQSVNEELATVNAELQTRVADLSQVNNDMSNLLAGTGIATIFVDHQLRILRFTPTSSRIINLIVSDVGRPVDHLVSNLAGYDQLAADVQGVLDTLQPKAVEVQTKDGKWYAMRIQPYRTSDNVIEGAVITFIDIMEMKQAEASIRQSELRFRTFVEQAPVAINVSRHETSLYANKKFIEIFGLHSVGDFAGRPLLDCYGPECLEKRRKSICGYLDSEDDRPFEYDACGCRPDDGQFPIHVVLSAIQLSDGDAYIEFVTDISGRQPADS